MKKILTMTFTLLFVLAFASNSYAQNSNGLGDLLEKAKEKIKDLVDEFGEKIVEKLEDKIKEAKQIVEQLLKELKKKMEGREKVKPERPFPERGYNSTLALDDKIKDEMGVKLYEINQKTREMLNIGDKGLLVLTVYPKMQADGILKVGDILLTADGKKLSKIQDLVKIISSKKKNRSIKFHLTRAGKEMDIVFKLKKKKQPQTQPDKPKEKKKPKKRKKYTEKELDNLLEEFYEEGDKKDPDAPGELSLGGKIGSGGGDGSKPKKEK